MKRNFLLGALLGLFGSVQAQDYLIKKHEANYSHEQNITLDGQYWQDPFWTGTTAVPRVASNGNITIGSTDNTFEFAATYDNTNLYIVVLARETYDPALNWFKDDSPSNTPWEDDAIEIFIDPKNGSPLFQAIVSHKGFNASPELWVNSNYNATGIQYSTAFMSGVQYIYQYQAEVIIPWSKFGITPTGGLSLGLDIAVDDDDNGGARDGQIAWKGTANNHNSTANYGQVKLQAAMFGVPTTSPYNGAPVIDGQVLYDPAYSYVANITEHAIGTSDNTANVRLLWDNTYLYVGIVVYDNGGLYVNTLYNDSPEIWNDDGIEIFIDPQNTKLPYFSTSLHRQISVQYSTTGVPPEVSVRGNSTGILAASALFQSKIYTGGYAVEVAIPWSNLGITPSVAQYIGFDITVNDDDNGGARDAQLVWKGTANNYQDASVWGNIQLMYNGYTNNPAITRVAADGDFAFETSSVETTCYPNPVKDQLTVQLSPAASSLKVTDIHGRELVRANVEGTTQYFINTTSFESGLYLVTVVDLNGKVETFKIAK